MEKTLTFTLKLCPAKGKQDILKGYFDLQACVDIRQLAVVLRQALQEESGSVEAGCGLLEFAREHNRQFSERVGHGRSRSSLYKYEILLRHLTAFVALARCRREWPLTDVDEGFVRDFATYLRTDLGLASGTSRLYLTALKRLMRLACRQGLLQADPFAVVDLPPAAHRHYSLTKEEVARLSALPLSGTRAGVRDLFLLSCFTGLAYADVRRLRREDIERCDTTGWLTKPREKNGRVAVVRLMPEAVAMIDRLRWRTDGSGMLAVPDNRTCNRHLHVRGLNMGLKRQLHFHIGRHTFATLLLSAGVPIETVSLMLGHSRITTTQMYAQVTRNKIVNDTMNMSRAFL